MKNFQQNNPPLLLCLDLINTLLLRDNKQFTKVFIDTLVKFGITNLNMEQTSNRIREKYLEYSLGNYHDDADYLRSILLYYVDSVEANQIAEILIPHLLEHFYPMDSYKDFLDYCFGKYKLVLASNFVEDWAKQLLDKFNMSHYFERIYVSSSLRFRKPAKEFYLAILNDYSDIKKGDFLVIGDSIINDYHGSKKLGMQAILFDNKKAKEYYHQSFRLNFEQIKQII